ncbi:MAG TPA: alpha/beta hydrolase-fold protein [Herpetosiphonaceae bacterium]
MHPFTTEPSHPLLRALVAGLEAGDQAAEARFWAEVEADGAPLLAPAGDEVDVTFVWRGDEATGSVAVIQDWGADGIRELLMARVPGSAAWHLTRRLPADTRTTYQLAPSPDPLAPELTADNYRLDPLNPRTYAAYVDEAGGWSINFSLLELPAAPPLPWEEANAPGYALAGGSLELSQPLGDERRVWVYQPAGDPPGPHPLLLVFDGRLYKDQMGVTLMLDALIAAGRIPPVVAALIDNPDRQELVCDEDFAATVAERLIPWLRERYPVSAAPERTYAMGSSYGGLGAAFLALRYPQTVGAVISQTGWFRWAPAGDAELEWLARQIAAGGCPPIRFYLDVGSLETARLLDGGLSQLEANRHMRTVLQAKGCQVAYREYHGGHDYSSLRQPLYEALAAMIK